MEDLLILRKIRKSSDEEEFCEIIAIGNLAGRAFVNYVNSGPVECMVNNVTLYVNKPREHIDKGSQELVSHNLSKEAKRFDVVLVNDAAKYVGEHCLNGTQVMIIGRLMFNSKKQKYYIFTDHIACLETKFEVIQRQKRNKNYYSQNEEEYYQNSQPMN